MTVRLAVLLALVAVGCGGHEPLPAAPRPPRVLTSDERAVLATANAYMDAWARGDGEAACRLVTDAALQDAGWSQRRCARELNGLRELGNYPIVDVELQSEFDAVVTIDDPIPESVEALPLHWDGTRWMLDGV